MTESTQPDEAIRYSAAAAELETILDEIETGAVDMDVLTDKVERAAMLIKLCRESLAGTELKVTKVLEDLERDHSSEEDDGVN